MIEELFEIFDIKTNEVFATNMKKDIAIEFIGSLYNHFYLDYELELGIRRTQETINALCKEN